MPTQFPQVYKSEGTLVLSLSAYHPVQHLHQGPILLPIPPGAIKPKKRRAYRSGSGEPIVKEENLIIWFRYIAERQRVFHRWFDREPSPWTEDATIRMGRMCNVHRYCDRESVWSIANLVEPLRHRPADLLFNIIMFRCYFNWHKSAEKVGLQSSSSFDRVKFEAALRSASAELGKLSSAAYNVGSFQAFQQAAGNGIGVKPARAVSRQFCFLRLYCCGLIVPRWSLMCSQAAMFEALAPKMEGVVQQLLEHKNSEFTFKTVIGLPGVGEFTGWQACLDLGYWNPDVYNESEHVIVGPGAEEGLSWLFADMGGLDGVGCVRYLVANQIKYFRKAGVGRKELRRLFGHMPAPPVPSRTESAAVAALVGVGTKAAAAPAGSATGKIPAQDAGAPASAGERPEVKSEPQHDDQEAAMACADLATAAAVKQEPTQQEPTQQHDSAASSLSAQAEAAGEAAAAAAAAAADLDSEDENSDGGVDQLSPLNLMSVENCLCEGNKYFRVRYQDGSGRFKQRYVARKGEDDSYRSNFKTMTATLTQSWHSNSNADASSAAPPPPRTTTPWRPRRLNVPSSTSCDPTTATCTGASHADQRERGRERERERERERHRWDPLYFSVPNHFVQPLPTC